MLSALKQEILLPLSKIVNLEGSQILGSLEVPKKIEQGDLSFPVFSLSKVFKKSPLEIAKDLTEELNKNLSKFQSLEKVEALSGFVNFYFKQNFLQKTLIGSLQKKDIGFKTTYKNKKIIVDFSSPNMAKPMGIGHLRSAIIGQAICNLARSQGFEVVGVDHIGDWGVQFGRLAWAYTKWADEEDFKKDPFESLYKLYVRFHKESEENPKMLEEGSLIFKKLEQGDLDVKKLWEKFVSITLEENAKIYKTMGISHSKTRGESFYNNQLKSVEDKLLKRNLLEEDDKAMIVRLDDEDMPPCLIRKSDGSSLYATRELAAAIHRFEIEKADEVIIETDLGQSLHFKQVKSVLKKMGYKWTDKFHHVGHGLYKFKDEKMSTRKGNIIFLKDVISQSIELMKRIIEEKKSNLKNKDKLAKQVGLGALYFNDLVNDRVKDIIIDWDRILDFKGDSGPYIQYCQVRCKSLIRKYKESGKEVLTEIKHEFSSSCEKELIRVLLSYEDILESSFKNLKPHILANYLLDLCHSFSSFYHSAPILGETEDLESSRIVLVSCVQKVIESGLSLLNIESPDFM